MTEIPGFGAGGATYLDYLVPGVVVMTALFSSGWSGMGVIEDIDRGIMDRFLVAPVHRPSLIIGRVAYDALTLVLQAVVIGGLAWLLGPASRAARSASPCSCSCALLLAASFGAISDALGLALASASP